MLYNVQGDLLESGCHALVNTVNCVGIMGKGIALQFKKQHPENFKQYVQECKLERMRPGSVFQAELESIPHIFNFATKDHWRAPSQIEWISKGLTTLGLLLTTQEIPTVAVPPLGCGNGGLDFKKVKPLIEEALGDLMFTTVFLYGVDK